MDPANRRVAGRASVRLIGALVVVGALCLAALPFARSTTGGSKDAASRPSQAATKVSARIKWFTYAAYAGTVCAKDWGIFDRHGLDVTVNQGGPQVDATKLVASGADQFGIAGGDQIIIARSRGLPIVAVAALMQETPAGFMVHADSDIRSMRDFPGHSMRIIPGHNTEIEYRAAMHKLGIPTNSVKEVVNLSELQLFMSRQVDIEPVYVNNQPATARAKGVAFRLLSPTEYGVRSYGNTYFTTEKMLREQPDVVQRFVASVLDGWEGAFRDPERAITSVLKHGNNLDRAVEMEKLVATRPLMERPDGRMGWMESERWRELVTVLQDAGALKDPVNVESLFDNRFVAKYHDDKEKRNAVGSK